MRASAHHLRRSKHRAPGRRGGVGGVPCRSALQAGLRSFLALLICGVSKTRSSGRLIRWHSSVRAPGCKKRRLRAVRYGIVFWRSPIFSPTSPSSIDCNIARLRLHDHQQPFAIKDCHTVSLENNKSHLHLFQTSPIQQDVISIRGQWEGGRSFRANQGCI
jgi:hypothetical protein